MFWTVVFYVIEALAALIALITAWGWLPWDYWWIRGTDFPRIQLFVLGAIAWLGLLVFYGFWQGWQWVLFAALSVALLFQLRMVLPYTVLWKKQVKTAKPTRSDRQIKIMVSNVLTPNNNTQALLQRVADNRPDVLITLESDKKWERALEHIEHDYPYTVKVPLDNLYGMHLYSKLELVDPQVKYLMIEDVPSIHTRLRLPTGQLIWLYCLHPMPPSPTEATTSTTRDAELLLMGRHIKDNQQTAILAGDLNDVAWSRATRRFQRISKLLDPRVGRNFTNTFHAKYPVLRWALDHLFHSPCFTLVNINRLPSIGSDHFPVLTVLQYEPAAAHEQQGNAPTADAQDRKQSAQTIAEGSQEGQNQQAGDDH